MTARQVLRIGHRKINKVKSQQTLNVGAAYPRVDVTSLRFSLTHKKVEYGNLRDHRLV